MNENTVGQVNENTERIIVIGSLVLLGILGATLATNWPSFEINSKISTDAYDLVLKYLFLIIIFERSIEVYNAVRFEGRSLKSKGKIKICKEKLKAFEKLPYEEKMKYTDKDDDYQALQTEENNDAPHVHYLNMIKKEQDNLDMLSEKTRKFSMRTLMFLGIIFAIGGLSVLGDVLEISRLWYQEAAKFQVMVIRFLDIVITGALIGGGSKSLHALLSTIQSVLDRVKRDREEQ